MGANGNMGAIYAGRFIAGLGVWQTVVMGPVYLAEIVSKDQGYTYLRISANSDSPLVVFVVSVYACLPDSCTSVSCWHISQTMAVR